MKILFLSSSYATFIKGHWQNWSPRHELASDLVKKGHEVFVVTPQIDESKEFEIVDGVTIYRFGKKKQVDFRKIKLLSSIIYMLQFFFTSLKIAKKHKVDLIHAFWAIPSGYLALCLSRILKKPYTVELLGNDVFMALHHPIAKHLAKAAIDNADYVITDGWSLVHYAEKHGCRKMKKVFVHFYESRIPKPDKKMIEKYRKKWNIKKDFKVILVNRIKLPHYGAEFVIKALPLIRKKIPSIRLLMVGSAGNYKQKIDEEIEKNNARDLIIETGYLNKEEIAATFKLSQIYVNPSLSDSTSVGLLEAMYAGLPIIASSIGDNPYWVTKENGIIVEGAEDGIKIIGPLDKNIAGAVIEMFSKKNLKEMGKKSRQRVEKECENAGYIKKQIQIYEELIKK